MFVPRVFVVALRHCLRTVWKVLLDLGLLIVLALRSRTELAAENLFLRKQLALLQERKVRPRRAEDSTRWVMATLSRLFAWRNALVNVKADTFLRWHRKGFRLFWRWKSKRVGRPPLPKNLRELIRRMASENRTWGEERIANELKLKLGILVSPRTVGKYLQDERPRRDPDPKQRWRVFVRDHAQAMVACDFFVVVTATFRTLYVFVILELGSRRVLHHNVTAHPTAEWTLQQFREALPDASSVSIRASRPGQRLLPGAGRTGSGDGCARIADAGAGAEGEFAMRTFRRKPAARVPGFPDSVPGASSPICAEIVDRPL